MSREPLLSLSERFLSKRESRATIAPPIPHRFFPCSIPLLLLLLTGALCATERETVKIAPGHKGFLLDPSGKRFVLWGHNYATRGHRRDFSLELRRRGRARFSSQEPPLCPGMDWALAR
jgi:hypothetical protein